MVMSDEEKTNTAYHEAGHAIVALNMPGTDPVHKATIIPRGRALGMVMQLPEGDRISHTREWCVSRLAIAFGGREAEIIKAGSDKVGRVRYQSNEQEVFLGHSVAQSTNISDETAQLIDAEVRGLIEEGERTARQIIMDKRDDWEKIAQALLEFETLTGDEIKDLLNGKRPNRESVIEPSTPRGSAVPTAGKPRPRPGGTGGMEPQPQA